MSLRIIAGTAKGRRLTTLEGEATRPTQGKVRAALFSILVAEVRAHAWLDLYAGSGAVGLEAASRGASRVVLVEQAHQALEVIRANVAATKLANVTVLARAVETALRELAGQAFDVVFLDPPYACEPTDVLGTIVETGVASASGLIVLEHRGTVAPPATAGPWALARTTRYTDSALSFYRP